MKGKRNLPVLIAGVLSLGLVIIFGAFLVQGGRASETGPILNYPSFPPTPTVPPAPNSGGQTRGQSSQVNLEQGPLENTWEIVNLSEVLPGSGATWELKDGALFQKGTEPANDPNELETLAVVRNSDHENYTVSAKVYDEMNATFGLVARRSGNSFYRFRMIADQYETTPKIVIDKVVDGTVTQLAAVDGPGYKQRTWYTIALKVNGSKIEALVGNQVVATATDSSLTHGQAGVYTRAFGGIRFTDVAITQ